eukprot:351935-Chlamydomonas_euryale.AAC.2
MESHDSPGPSAGATNASGSEDLVGISLVNCFRSSSSAPLARTSLRLVRLSCRRPRPDNMMLDRSFAFSR